MHTHSISASLVVLLAGTASAQFGARFEPPAGRILHGVGQESFSTSPHNRVPQYEAALGAALAPAIDKTYLTLSQYLTSPRNPRARFLSYLGAVAGTGKVPEVGIDILPDAAVAAGTYDAEITAMAQDLRGYQKPIFARPGVEIANSWNAYTPFVFVQAWRRLVDIFRRENADNVAFVWCIAAVGYSTFNSFDPQINWDWSLTSHWPTWLNADITVNSGLVALYAAQLGQSRYLHKSANAPFVGPYPRSGHVQAAGQGIGFAFDGLTAGVDVWLAIGVDRIVANPGAAEKDRDYGLALPPAGYLKVVPLIVVNAGPAPAQGSMPFSFPPLNGPGVVHVQAYHDGRFSTEIRIEI
jgi:hypothetical protein